MELLLEKIGEQKPTEIEITEDLNLLYSSIREEYLRRVSIALLKQKNDPEVHHYLQETIKKITKLKIRSIPEKSYEKIAEEMCDDILGYGPITSLINDPDIGEVMVNRYNSIFYEKEGKLYPTSLSFRNEEHLMLVIYRMVDEVGRRIDISSPRVDARLPNGSRINAIIPPVAPDGAVLTVRKFKKKLKKEDLIAYGTFPGKYLSFFQACIDARLNILVTGGTSSGKTSFLNFLCSLIGENERIITIEDSLELNIKTPNLIRLESRSDSSEGTGKVTIRDLVINSLRMRPDRLIVGEVRGSEAMDMLQAMNTGHDGSMSTGHSNAPEDMLSRLESMVLMAENFNQDAIRAQIASGIDIVIHLERFSKDGSRKVVRIIEVLEYKDGKIQTADLFKFEQDFSVKEKVVGELKMIAGKDSPTFKKIAEY